MPDSRIPEDPVAELLQVLNLKDSGENSFQGTTQWMPGGRVFGGQVLAQSLVAASATVDQDRRVHSLHSYFLRPGALDVPIDFEVDILRDGRSFSARRVQASQESKVIFSMIASFQIPTDGVEHADKMPTGVSEPETLPSAKNLLGSFDHPVARYWANARPFDLRHEAESVYLKPATTKSNEQAVWFKPVSELKIDGPLAQAALAYASDYTILESIMRAHGLSWAHPGLKSASLDHAMWFHAEPDFSDWMLYVQRSPAAQSGRGLATGQIFNRNGVLVASVAQEGMMRIPAI